MEDIRYHFYWYSLLSALDPEIEIKFDVLDVINSGYVAIESCTELENTKLIIFTEGKTDIKFIKTGFELFYPYLLPFLHFIDFDTDNLSGSASQLVHYIKAFKTAGTDSAILAIFDNDSAAKDACRALSPVVLPINIKYMHYPEIDFLKEYPTRGPTGLVPFNINGHAASIEMYLGRDCLTKDDELLPIVWTSYLKSVKQYQGEIDEKDYVQKQFADRLTKGLINKENNPELYTLVTAIKNAWQN